MTLLEKLAIQIQNLQTLILINGGGTLDIVVDNDFIKRLHYECGTDQSGFSEFQIYGPMCKTTIRAKND